MKGGGRGGVGREIARNWPEFVSFNWQTAPRPPTILPSPSLRPQFHPRPPLAGFRHCDNNYSYSLFYKLTLAPRACTFADSAMERTGDTLHSLQPVMD